MKSQSGVRGIGSPSEGEVGGGIFSRRVQEDLAETVKSEQKPKRGEIVIHADFW